MANVFAPTRGLRSARRIGIGSGGAQAGVWHDRGVLLDLSPLVAGARSTVAQPGGAAHGIEGYPERWRPGQCAPVRGDATTIFTAPLVMLGCGVIVLRATVPALVAPSVDLIADLELALALATPLGRAIHGSAIGAPFAPVVLDVAPPARASSLGNVRRALEVAAPIADVGIIDAEAFSAALAEVEDGVAAAAAVATLAAGFARLRDPRELWLGVDDAERPNFDSIPVLWVGTSAHGRVVGLLAEHVD